MAFGGVAGGLIAHLSSGISRADAKELGDLIAEHEAAIMIVGKERVDQPIEELMTRAQKKWEGELGVDRAEFEKELTVAVEKMEAVVAAGSPARPGATRQDRGPGGARAPGPLRVLVLARPSGSRDALVRGRSPAGRSPAGTRRSRR